MTMVLIEFQGQPAAQVRSPDGAQAIVLLQGAQVVSWVPAGAAEQLYLSPQAIFAPGQAVRGGVPVIFPQFEQRGPDRSLPRHGFARTQPWRLESQRVSGEHAQATLVLSDNEATRALWPHRFTLELTVAVSGAQLDLELFVHNSGETAWPFSAALHTYLAVSDLQQVRLQGLQGLRFVDMLRGDEHLEDHPEKRFYGEIDRIYAKAGHVLLIDGARRLGLGAVNLPDAVLWNPGPQRCAALRDMPADGWRNMLCIEAARVLQPKTLAPAEDWTARQSLLLQSA